MIGTTKTIATDLALTKAQREALRHVGTGAVVTFPLLRGGTQYRVVTRGKHGEITTFGETIPSGTISALRRRGLIDWPGSWSMDVQRVSLTERGTVAHERLFEGVATPDPVEPGEGEVRTEECGCVQDGLQTLITCDEHSE